MLKKILTIEFYKARQIVPLYVFNHCTLPTVFKIHTVVPYIVYVHDIKATELNPKITMS